jgi:microcompartment protein CcmL/EutN
MPAPIDRSPTDICDALAAVEFNGLVRGARVADAVLKAADVRVLASVSSSGPRHLLLFDGSVESVRLAFEQALVEGEGRVLDAVFLPFAHRSLVAGLAEVPLSAPRLDALLLVETATLSAALRALDAALKAVPIDLFAWRKGPGLAGRNLFALGGTQADLQAAEEVIDVHAGGGLLDQHLIANPDPSGPWAQPFGHGVFR